MTALLEEYKHIRISFRLKDGLQKDFAEGNPNPELEPLNAFLEQFGATVVYNMYEQCHKHYDTNTSLGKLEQKLADRFNADKDKTFERTVFFTLSDDRNMKAFYLSLRSERFENIVEPGSIEIEPGGGALQRDEIMPPPYPPNNKTPGGLKNNPN